MSSKTLRQQALARWIHVEPTETDEDVVRLMRDMDRQDATIELIEQIQESFDQVDMKAMARHAEKLAKVARNLAG